MVEKLDADGFQEFTKLLDIYKNSGKAIFLLFSGSKDAEGDSWCPDCVKADIVIEAGLRFAPSDSVFIHTQVGDRPTWKNASNPFRTDPQLDLKGVPTLMRYGSPERLQEEQCFDLDTVKMLFEEC